jgi:hypothetical protein
VRRAEREQAIDPSILAGIVRQNPKSEDDTTKDELLQLLSEHPIQQEVLRLHLEGFEGKEIAEKLGVSEATVSRRLKEAKFIISLRYKKDWGASRSTGTLWTPHRPNSRTIIGWWRNWSRHTSPAASQSRWFPLDAGTKSSLSLPV